MSETKEFPIEIILTLTTDVLLKHEGMEELHAFIEYVAGYPVFMHHMGNRQFIKQMAEVVFAQHPQLREAEPWTWTADEGVAPYLEAYVARARAKFGATLPIRKGGLRN